jgi:hypothetical protein
MRAGLGCPKEAAVRTVAAQSVRGPNWKVNPRTKKYIDTFLKMMNIIGLLEGDE